MATNNSIHSPAATSTLQIDCSATIWVENGNRPVTADTIKRLKYIFEGCLEFARCAIGDGGMTEADIAFKVRDDVMALLDTHDREPMPYLSQPMDDCCRFPER